MAQRSNQPVRKNGLAIEDLSKHFGRDGAVRAVDRLSLLADEGEFIVLLGPSGCGKTTLLRCLAGLERPTQGRVSIGDRVMSDTAGSLFVPTHRRNLGMVFQNYSLWPHMTVAGNVEYPLRTRRDRRTARERRSAVDEALTLVECLEFRDRFPAQLSGGQQQRIALARAIVANPAFILFDEPLSNLDFRLRAQLRGDLRELHRRLGFTGVYVTHDQIEAFQLGTLVAVMNRGRLEQLGSPQEIHDAPASAYVAAFLGIENRIAGTARDGTLETAVGAVEVPDAEKLVAGHAYEMFVRSTDMVLAAPGHPLGDQATRICDGVVVDSLYSGDQWETVVAAGDLRLVVATDPHTPAPAPGDQVCVGARRDRAMIFPDDAAAASADTDTGALTDAVAAG